MPAVLVALTLTFSRNAWVGACAGISLLFLLRDFRLVAVVPVAAALFLAFAPAPDRGSPLFHLPAQRSDEHGPAGDDSVGAADHQGRPADGRRTGHGHPGLSALPRSAAPSNSSQPHLHDVPLQIAAERGLPALAAWLWFIVVLLRDFWRKSRSSPLRSLPTAALASVVAMLAAGMFEYNFGDSEFLMLFLLLVTLPYAADRAPATAPALHHPSQAA